MQKKSKSFCLMHSYAVLTLFVHIYISLTHTHTCICVVSWHKQVVMPHGVGVLHRSQSIKQAPWCEQREHQGAKLKLIPCEQVWKGTRMSTWTGTRSPFLVPLKSHSIVRGRPVETSADSWMGWTMFREKWVQHEIISPEVKIAPIVIHFILSRKKFRVLKIYKNIPLTKDG